MQELPPEQPNIPVEEHKTNGFKKVMRISLRIIKYFLLIFLLLLFTAIILGWIYGDKIKQYAIDELNKNLNTQIYIHPNDIDFSIVKNFPLASVDFNNIKVLEAVDYKKKDTLLSAKLISFQFNFWDIFNENYTIKKLTLSDASGNLKVFKNGKNNYQFLKPDTTQNNTSKFNFALQKITITNSNFSYTDIPNKIVLNGNILQSHSSLKGNGNIFDINTESSIFWKKIIIDSTNYLSEKTTKLNFNLNIDEQNQVYSFTDINSKIEKLHLETKGAIINNSTGTDFDLAIEGKDLDIQSILSLLPSKYKSNISEYNSNGEFFFTSTLKGVLSKKSTPIFKCNFGVVNGSVSHSKTSVSLSKLNLNGKYTSEYSDTKKSFLNINSFSGFLGNGKIDGAFSISGEKNPYITAKAIGEIKLSDLQQLLQVDTIENINGNLKIDALFNGNINELKKYSESDAKTTETAGEISITDVAIKWKNNPNEWTNINGDFYLKNNDVGIRSFAGNISKTDFELQGTFKNALAYFFNTKTSLLVNAQLKSKKVDLNELLTDKESKNKNNYTLILPDDIDFNLNCDIGEIEFRNFKATDISGKLKMKDKRIIAEPLQFKTMKGNIKTALMIDARDTDKILITCDANVYKIDVNKLFYSFENFGQTYLQDKHLRGTLTANIQFASVCNANLVIDLDKIYSLCDISIDQGELIAFSPFIEIAADLKKDIVLRQLIEVDEFEQKMKHIKFSSLKNQVEIKNKKITFSPMLIKSSAMNIDFSGTHTFSNAIDYHFSFLLSEVLTKGEKKRKEQNKEFGEEENDGTGRTLYYLMTGTVDNPIFKKDFTTKKEKRKEEIKKEKQNLKQILKDEFGWFKKDSTLNKNEQKKSPDNKQSPNNNKFILNWEDEKEKKDKDDF